eukprot:m.141303 g.141303  ORF g.141303 m.141303 type:complete len:122 (-) comp52597_c0_seq3:521-886(-)
MHHYFLSLSYSYPRLSCACATGRVFDSKDRIVYTIFGTWEHGLVLAKGSLEKSQLPTFATASQVSCISSSYDPPNGCVSYVWMDVCSSVCMNVGVVRYSSRRNRLQLGSSLCEAVASVSSS